LVIGGIVTIKFVFDTVEYRANCIVVETECRVLLSVDTGFREAKVVPFTLHGVKNVKEDAIEFLERALYIEEDNLDWPLHIKTYVDPDDNSNYLARIYFKSYSNGRQSVECVNDNLVKEGLAEIRTY
jgi:hypothetical protein